ncbi:MAG TPA: DNA adenine methylase, partial [Clostridiales bacterium]|nr:DNA adenine methylase [Clostridiales bacterium]
VIDIFAGSGVVSKNFKKKGYKVYANDLLYFSYVLLKGTIGLNRKPLFRNLGIPDPIGYLNRLDPACFPNHADRFFIYKHYSPHEDCERMYFQNQNALKIDLIRLIIEEWKEEGLLTEEEYFYLLAALIEAVPYVSNITGIYGAYLKHWDQRTYNPLMLKHPEIVDNGEDNLCYNQDANQLVDKIEADLLYCDPPYNERQYISNYHILETIAKYDSPPLHGITGVRAYGEEEKSLYSKKKEASAAFDDLIRKAKCRYILVSYNNEGILKEEQIEKILKKYGKAATYRFYEYPYRRYKNKIASGRKGLKEQLFFIEKEV